MRKIKITALILAVLMVMAAFAGCASKSTVEDLDNRVSALEDKIDANQKANEELLEEIKDAISGNKTDSEKALTDAINGLKDLVNNNKSESDKALADAINSLTALVNNNKTSSDKALADAIAAMTEAQKTLADAIAANKADSDKALTDAIAEIQKAIEQLNKDKTDAEAAAAALQAAKQEKSILLAATKATYEAKQGKYAAEDYAAIVTAIATADIQIANAATIEAVNTIYAGVAGELAKYAQIDDYLYAQYLALKGNIVEANRAVAEAAYKYLTEVATTKFALTDDALKKYKTGEKNDLGQDVTVDLVTEIQTINGLYANQDSYNGQATLKKVTADAEKLVKQIADIGAVVYGQYTKVTSAKAAYETFKANAKKLSEANYALVTNIDVLTAADARMQQLEDAAIEYIKLGNFVAVGASGAYESVLKPLPTVDEPLYNTKEIFDAAINKINAWATAFSLDADNVKAIIADPTVDGKDYEAYLERANYVNEMVGAYQEFATDIAPRILAMNKLTALNDSAFAEYAAISDALEAWMVRVEEDLENEIEEIVVDDANMLAIINDILDLELDGSSKFVELFTFENDKNGVITTFFTDTFTDAMEAADDIEDLLDALDPETLYNVKALVAIRGDMKLNAAGNWEFLGETDTPAAGTIAAFLKEYVHTATTTDDLSYDLSILLPMEKYQAKRAAVEANLAKHAASAAALMKAYKAYVKEVADKFAAITASGITIDASVKTTYEFKPEVDKLVADYKAWVENGGVATMSQLVLVEDSTTEYEYKNIFDVAVYDGITEANAEIKAIGDQITVVERFYKALTSINTYYTIAVGTTNSKAITKIEEVKLANADKEMVRVAYKVTYIKSADGKTGTAYVAPDADVSTTKKVVGLSTFYAGYTDNGDGTITWTPTSDTNPAPKTVTVPTVADILANAETEYNDLLVMNATVKVAKVENTKLTNNYDTYKFTHLKTLAKNTLTDDVLEADENAIVNANSLNQLANAIVNNKTLANNTADFSIVFNGKTYLKITYAGGEYTVKTDINGNI